MFPENDNQFDDSIIKKVEPSKSGGFSITKVDGWSLFVPEYGHTPQVGDYIRVYTYGVSCIRGIFIKGVKVFYETEQEYMDRFKREQEERDRQEQEKYYTDKEATDARIALLPEVFQRRIQRFTEGNCDFVWKYLRYELFCCEEAMRISDRFKTSESVSEFYSAPWEKQKELMPELSDEHSGNTFGCACKLAQAYLADPSLVVRMHGALVPLVGCTEYGCTH